MIEYNVKLIRKMLSEEEALELASRCPLSDAVFIPCIKKEFREKDSELNESGDLNDKLIHDTLEELLQENYIGTTEYIENYYSDYFEDENNYTNILYYENHNSYFIGAIFLTPKSKLKQ